MLKIASLWGHRILFMDKPCHFFVPLPREINILGWEVMQTFSVECRFIIDTFVQ